MTAPALGLRLFDTAIGPCGIAWSAKALVGVQLPEGTPQQTLARMQRRFPEAVEGAGPAFVQVAVRRIQALLEGAHDSLADIPLDMDGVPAFNQRVYAVARAIPPGRVLTYGDVARAIGEPGASRAVGQALGHNPFAPVIPCHRVLAAGGRSGGFSATGGAATKLRMLEIEKAQFGKEPGLFD
ncbi:methylated-DNA--[protein]-cysteine S-methyltransferase [Ramlibacter albus]|uniref:Methylated-DNA--[protein]-cysteine S-methyltransferase n=1 Tax=Ramlibacter albus TaxID=2079448 RepID=A0A923M5X2_9BURK|nr:methylated-DNA--[protein]-cysteine S-methyltransferase [Ramlibacter albus]MBC5764401.1 methylated-DNA--[protein]-cysteine S-methyltransferase [Ramlibacter albus]